MGQCAGKPHLATRRAHSGRDSTIENVAARSLQPAEEVEAVEVVDATGAGAVIEATAEAGVITSLTIAQSGLGDAEFSSGSSREPLRRPGEP